MDFYLKYCKANELLIEAFKEMGEMLCTRCFSKKAIVDYHHQLGLSSELLKVKKKISENDLKKFIDDSEHGLFHGLFVAAFALILLKKQNYCRIEKIKIVVSCILHDLLRSLGYSQKDHGPKLENYFPSLIKETYYHNLVKDNNNIGFLIKADRIELMRYEDWREWINLELLSFLKIDSKIMESIYSQIRPALYFFYQNENKTLIRHGWEGKNFFEEKSFPVNYLGKEKGNFPIELDSIPFCRDEKWSGIKESCAYHGDGCKWQQIKGFICLKNFKESGYELVENSSLQRDHLYARGTSSAKKWVFLSSCPVDKKDIEEYRLQVEKLIRSNNRICDNSLFEIFFRCKKLFVNYLKTVIVDY